MITLRPFRSLYYDPAAAGDLAAVIAPPYDVIDEGQLERLYARSPFNVVRLILNREPDRYAAAAAELAAWKASGVLRRDPESCLYWYVQDFRVPGGGARQRSGLIGTVRLEPFESGNIRPHERTFARAKEDRLRLLRACRTNLSPIFGMYPHREEVLASVRPMLESQPWVDVTDEAGERHRLWRIADPARIDEIARALRESSISIADGHHRYETALAYRDELQAQGSRDPEAPHNFVLMYLASMGDPGLVILPTHRLLHRLPSGNAEARAKIESHFTVQALPGSAAGLRQLRAALEADQPPGTLGLRWAGEESLLLLRLQNPGVLEHHLSALHPVVRHLDVSVLDSFLLRDLLGIDCAAAAQEGRLTYTHDDEKADAAARSGSAAAAFFMRPPRIAEVEAACLAGQTMPQKSTYFYPKLLSGLVFHPLESS